MAEMGFYKKGNSTFHNADPRIKIAWMFVVPILVYTYFNPTIPLILTAISLSMLVWSTKGYAIKNPLAQVLLIGSVSSILMHSFVNPQGVTPITIWGSEIAVPFFGSMKWEGLYAGVTWAFRLLAIGYTSLLVVATTRPRDFTEALVKLKVPFRFAFMALLTLQLIQVFERDAKIIVEAQRSRGLKDVKLVDKIKALLPLFTPLVVSSLERIQIMSMSLEARAFGAPTKRTELMEMKLHSRQYIILFALIGLTGASLAYRLTGDINWIDYVRSFKDLFIPPNI
jgi:energy-coupling factor transport system permease protein